MMGLYEGQQSGPDRARRRARIVFYVVTLAQILMAGFMVLGLAVLLAAVCKLIWRAWSFGWGLWL